MMVSCHLCCKEFPYEMRHYMFRSEEEIRKNVHDSAVMICPQCAEKLLTQGYRSCTAKSGQRLILREGEE